MLLGKMGLVLVVLEANEGHILKWSFNLWLFGYCGVLVFVLEMFF